MASFQGCNFKTELIGGSYIDYDIIVYVNGIYDDGTADLAITCLSKHYDSETQEITDHVTYGTVTTADDEGGGGSEPSD